jgi:uncharacterized membrane protein
MSKGRLEAFSDGVIAIIAIIRLGSQVPIRLIKAWEPADVCHR